MDRFPEAFERFEKWTDVDQIEGYRELRIQFAMFAGKHWQDTRAQNAALRIEAERLGIVKPPTQRIPTRHYQRLKRIPRRTARREYAPEEMLYVPLKTQVTVKHYIERGWSANRIQKQMSAQGIGVRRTVLLRQIREAKRQPPRPHRERYIPKKYRK